MTSMSSSFASVGSDVPGPVTTCASFTSVPVAVAASVPVAVNVTLAPGDTGTTALMLPVPVGVVPHWAKPVEAQVHVTPCRRGENVSVTVAAGASLGPALVTTIE